MIKQMIFITFFSLSLSDLCFAEQSFFTGASAKTLFEIQLAQSHEVIEGSLNPEQLEQLSRTVRKNVRLDGPLYTQFVGSTVREDNFWKCGKTLSLVVGKESEIESSYESRVTQNIDRPMIGTYYRLGSTVVADYACFRK